MITYMYMFIYACIGHVQFHHRAISEYNISVTVLNKMVFIVTSGDIVYAGMLYYQRIEAYHWKSMYTVVRNLEVLIQVYLLKFVHLIKLH